MKLLRGGVSPSYHKEISLVNPIKNAMLPACVTIPLSQHAGAPAVALVKVGDHVKTGTLIGEPQGTVSAAVHASTSGVVKKIDLFPHPVLGQAPAIQIESDGKDEKVSVPAPRSTIDALRPSDLVALVKKAGVVGMGGAAFPTHVKLSPPPGKKIDTIIINGAECEPHLTGDHLLMLYTPVEIIKGAQIVMKCTGAQRGIIAVERNKMDAIEVLMSKLRSLSITDMAVVPLPVKYPQGAEKQIIASVTGRQVPSGKLPMDVGVVVQNAGTAYAIYEAVYLEKPLYERLVTVCGKSIRSAQNVRARIGMSFMDVIHQIGGLINPPGKVIMGGPMMGLAQSTLEVPVVKATSGIVLYNPGELPELSVRPCIRCGRCVSACPMGLVPSALATCGDLGRWDEAAERGVRDCMECGCCAYVCPAHRHMVQSVKLAKTEVARLDKTRAERAKAAT